MRNAKVYPEADVISIHYVFKANDVLTPTRFLNLQIHWSSSNTFYLVHGHTEQVTASDHS